MKSIYLFFLFCMFIGCSEEKVKEEPKGLTKLDSLDIERKEVAANNAYLRNRFINQNKSCYKDSVEFEYTYQFQDFIKKGFCFIIEAEISDLKENKDDYTIFLRDYKKLYILGISKEEAELLKNSIEKKHNFKIIAVIKDVLIERAFLNVSGATYSEREGESYATLEVSDYDNPFIIAGTLTDFQTLD